MAQVMNTWEAIREGTDEVERLIGQKQYNFAMIKARQTLEIMVRTLAERGGIQLTDMAATIDDLYTHGIISQTTAEHYHKIRMIGNKAAHEGDENPSGANAAYHLLSQELYTFAKDFAPGSGSARRARAAGNASRYGSGSSAFAPDGSMSRGSSDGSRNGGSSRSGYGSGGGSNRSRDIDARRVSHRTTKKSTFSPELIFKVMVPIVVIVLIFGIFKVVKDKKTEEVESEQELQIVVETTAPETEPPTTVPETTEPETVMVYTVIPEVLNVRSEPNTDCSKLGQLKQGETISYISDVDEEWALINYNDQEGYVNKQYVDVRSADPAQLAAEAAEAEGAGDVQGEEAADAQ